MNARERIAELERENERLRNETAEERAERENRLAEARQREERAAQARVIRENRVGRLQREIAHLEEWRDTLLRYSVEATNALTNIERDPRSKDDYDAYTPQAQRERETWLDTTDEIQAGVGRWSTGLLREWAARDGLRPLPDCQDVFERRPGLLKAERLLTELRKELADLSG